jgi:peptidoglycan/xylan/chitin deacetylase (PgdA/CDA1 family)
MDEPSTPHLLFHVVGRAVPGAISAADLKDRLEAEIGAHGGVRVSFDDAHPSIRDATPVLRALGLEATVFASSAHVGKTDHVLDYAELTALDPLWTVGSHAHRHERLGWRQYGENDAAWRARVGRAVRTSRDALTRGLGRPVHRFAYPFGEAPGGARDAVREAGFTAAWTVDGSMAWDGDPMGRPRLDGTAVEPDDATPGISVIVPACDRLPVLREVVRRLVAQSYPRFEVIVVDDGSRTPLSSALDLEGLVAEARRGPEGFEGPSAVRVLRLPQSDARFRAGQARQWGSAAARYEVLAFLDADVAVDRDYLWHLAWVHAREPRAVLLGCLSGYNLQDLGWRHELADVVAQERLTGDVFPVIPDRSREPTLAACMDNIALLDDPWTLAYTGNLSVRRDLLNQVGGFATEFEGWGFEDVDLGVRLHLAGADFMVSRFALGYHVADPEPLPLSNPFRQPSPKRETFTGVLANLETLAARHRGHAGIEAFCASVRADVDEICGRPYTVGVMVDGPGGFSIQQILDRVAYAHRVEAKELYLLGPGVGSREDLGQVVEAARGLAVVLEVEPGAIDGGRVAELEGMGIEVRES